MFKKYPKIYRLGKEEVEGILIGVCSVSEKIDGANVSIWVEEGEIICGSRNQPINGGFNGFTTYVKENKAIQSYLKDNPTHRLYGEWLVRHTIKYNEKSYRKFYLFDITLVSDKEDEDFRPIVEVESVAKEYGFIMPTSFGVFTDPSFADLKKLVGKTELGEKGEGIVIRNESFVSKYGNRMHGKLVSEDFKEDNSVAFKNNNKSADAYWEMYVAHKYITHVRVKKTMDKLYPLIEKKLDFEHTSRISSTVYNDMLVEEIWSIQKKVEHINFRKLKSICNKKAALIYKELLTKQTHVKILS